jgi:uncharacterized YkwD family protein
LKKIVSIFISIIFLMSTWQVAYGQSYEQQVASLVNKERTSRGLKALAYNSALAKMAEDKAKDMYNNNYFSHTSPTYGSPFQMMNSYGISYRSAGENIAKGQRTPQEVMNAWMNSSGHRANILNSSYNQIGVGYYNGVWVQEFIQSSMAPSNPQPQPQPQPKPQPSPSPSYSQYYTVKSGDTLWLIAKKNWITLTQIKILNPKMTNYNRLYVGQKVRVRANLYYVKSGDTAWEISQRYGMALWELRGLNPQDTNIATLYIGQKLYVR